MIKGYSTAFWGMSASTCAGAVAAYACSRPAAELTRMADAICNGARMAHLPMIWFSKAGTRVSNGVCLAYRTKSSPLKPLRIARKCCVRRVRGRLTDSTGPQDLLVVDCRHMVDDDVRRAGGGSYCTSRIGRSRRASRCLHKKTIGNLEGCSLAFWILWTYDSGTADDIH